MTANQLKYWDLQRQKAADAEVQRANQARERLNEETLAETKRANLAREMENYRSNFARESETSRANYAAERENIRANMANELLKSQGLSIQDTSNRLQAARDMETARANQARENIQTRQNNLTAQKNANEYSLRSNELAETKQYHVQSIHQQKVNNATNLVGTLGNAIARVVGAKLSKGGRINVKK